MHRYTHPLWMLALLAVMVVAVGCDEDSDDEPAISMFLSDVRVGSVEATLEDGAFPTDGSESPPTVNGSTQIVRGGSVILQVTTPDNAEELLIGLENENGYYRVDLDEVSASPVAARAMIEPGEQPTLKVQRLLGTTGTSSQDAAKASAPAAVYTVILTSASNEDYPSLPLQIATRTSDGLSAPNTYRVMVNESAAASGQLQVSLNWNQPVDLDLHVETPNEEDIYYGNRTGTNGGQLDLDSNAACGIDNVNNENITWGEQAPASGDYVVRVDLWSACDVSSEIDYVVTVNVCGSVQTFDGSFDPSEEDAGGAFDGRVITTLEDLSFPCD